VERLSADELACDRRASKLPVSRLFAEEPWPLLPNDADDALIIQIRWGKDPDPIRLEVRSIEKLTTSPPKSRL
jgi:hypothetical protein